MSVLVTGTLEPYPGGNYRPIDDTFTFLLGLGGASVAVATDVADTRPIASYQGTLHRVDMTAKTGPVGAALIVDVLFSTDGGSTFTSLWATHTGNRPQIADGSTTGSQTSFDTSTYVQGTVWRIDVKQVGSSTAGSGILVKLV